MVKLYLFVRRYLAVVMLMGAFSAFAQQSVSGKVTSSDDGSGIPGVNILEKGTSNGTVSDADGNYTISVGANATLVFSFVGYAAQEVAVGSQTSVNVSMKSDITSLSEVVVIGYGEVSKKDLTGAVASVKSEDFIKGVISSPEQLIQGKTAGVQITSASGEPGAGVNVRIRGTSSVRGGNNPLFVVDGIPLTGDDVSPGGADLGRGSSSARNPLNFINPNDIESIDVLKDASATAIYGSRGANGVVIVTTKSGKGKKRQIEYSSSVSVSEQAKFYDLLKKDQFLAGIAKFGGDPVALNLGSSTDWQKEIIRTAVSNRHDLSYSDNFATGGFRASVSYDDQQGIIRNSGLTRLTGRLNANKTFLDEKLKLGAQVTFSNIKDQAAPITNNAGFEGDLLGSTYMANPTWKADADVQPSSSNANPNSLLKYFQDNSNTNRSLINLSASYDITKEISIKVNTGFDNSDSERKQAYSPKLFLTGGIFGNGRAGIGSSKTSSNLLEAFVNYKKDLNGSTLSAVAGYSYQDFNSEGLTVAGWGFNAATMDGQLDRLAQFQSFVRGYLTDNDQQYGFDGTKTFRNTLLPTPVTIQSNISSRTASLQSAVADKYKTKDELQSYFARVNYSIGEKYLFTASFRADGSTRFGGDNKYGFFPSAAAAWRLSEEDFIPDFFDDLKFRVGYGITGNQSIPHNLYQRRQRYNGIGPDNGGNVNNNGLTTIAFDNPKLKWEQTSQLNIGLDFGILGNKLTGSLDYYQKTTTDLLIQVTSAQPAPQPFTYTNLPANVVNKGIELTLNYKAIDKADVGLSFALNGAYNTNIVENFNGVVDTGAINGQGLSGAFAQRIANGQPLYAFFLRDFDGYDAQGIAKYKGGDFQKFLDKSPLPTINMGFTINARYKNFDFNTFFAGQFGQYVYNNSANAFFTAGSIGNGRNVTANVLTSGESNVNAPDVSTRFLESADFVRLQNLNIGYNFKLENMFIKKLRLSVGGQNLFVLTSYTGLDPEVNTNKSINDVPSAGIDYNAYPRARVFTFGLNATF